MPKKSLYHPVSVNVLRGALEFCGIVPGRLIQLRSNFETAEAVYRFELEKLPKEYWGKQPHEIARAINGCFSSDVKVEAFGLRYDKARKITKVWVTIHCKAALPFEPNILPDVEPEYIYDRPMTAEIE